MILRSRMAAEREAIYQRFQTRYKSDLNHIIQLRDAMNPTNSQTEQLTYFDELVITRCKGQRDSRGHVTSVVDVAAIKVPTPYHCRDGSGTDDAGKAASYAVEEFLWSQGCKSPSRALYNTTKAELDRVRKTVEFFEEEAQGQALAVQKWSGYAIRLEQLLLEKGIKIPKHARDARPK